ncbi:MAG: hypothetical protein JNL38_41530 [Myxococcales bacterium]|nr:hypothetical protein [Myxococcales bacterium]
MSTCRAEIFVGGFAGLGAALAGVLAEAGALDVVVAEEDGDGASLGAFTGAPSLPPQAAAATAATTASPKIDAFIS